MYDILSRYIPADRISTNEPLAKHTSFKIGGPADVYVQPASRKELMLIISECRRKGAAFIILGHASNVLVPDEGLRQVVIQLHPHFSASYLAEDGTCIIAEAGASLATVANFALQEGLGGMEFASGIPGTVGGAVCMNAGAYGHEISDICMSVDVLLPSGDVKQISKEEMNFAYRASAVQTNGGIVLSAKFALSHGDRESIQAYMRELNSRRRESQPLDVPSVGSTFKRPAGNFAGKLIEDAGLKGAAIGGAMVSKKHAGFVVNTGGATASDVLGLMEHIQNTVRDQYGIILEPEVKILCNS